VNVGRLACLCLAAAFAAAPSARAEFVAPPPAPPLPPPTGDVVTVSTVAALHSAVDNLVSGRTILIAAGTYNLERQLHVNGVANVAIRGATGNRNQVVLRGSGMAVPGVPHGIECSNAQNLLIADLSIGEVQYHPLQLHGEAGCDRVRIYNVRLFDAGEQFVKGTVNFGAPNGVDDGVLEYSVLEYTTIGPNHGYTNGIDIHRGENWVIRYNLFRNIRVPQGAPQSLGPAVLMWSGARNTTTYANTFINCERAIAYGIGPQAGFAFGHQGGTICGNFIYRAAGVPGDAGITVWDSPGTQVLHNTVVQSGTYPDAIDYRFPGSSGLSIKNNLLDGGVRQRDGASASLAANVTTAAPALFENPSIGDLHLRSTASVAIDQGVALAECGADWDGQPRPAGPARDIGADELVPMSTLSIGDVSTAEGHAGTGNAVFTVTLSAAGAQAVTVGYGTAGGTATPGVDFGTVGGTVSFAPGVTTRTVAVPILGDRVDEVDESFFVNLGGATGATIADGQGQGTILDDDPGGLTIGDAVVRERVAPGTAVATFTVTLAPASGAPATVDWATVDGTATAGSDYVAGGGTLTFNPGVGTQTVSVVVNADALVEGVETFTVTLSGASGATIAHPTGTGRILDPPAGGDFNADNRNDLLWRHDVSGENVLWFMNGANLLSGVFTTPPTLPDVRWKMVGTNDFNADGRPDILWRHSTSGENVLWYMNGSTLAAGTFLTPATLADVRWGMSGTGDFNLDGRPDILWRHSTSGEIVVWFMNGSVLHSGTFLTPPAFADVNWQAVGTGDVSGDGKTDILWRHAVSGQNVVWFLEGTSLVSGAFLSPAALPDVRWRMVAVGDYNFDGKVDIVWRHSFSGENVIWFMDGINLLSGTFTTPSSLPDNGWKIVGPR
jgi:hypothetical protein